MCNRLKLEGEGRSWSWGLRSSGSSLLISTHEVHFASNKCVVKISEKRSSALHSTTGKKASIFYERTLDDSVCIEVNKFSRDFHDDTR